MIADRVEKATWIVTTNLPFSEWTQVFPNPRLCKALLDRITDRAQIIPKPCGFAIESGLLERRFPESRRKAYYLMSIHEHLPPQVRKDLKDIGWTKGRELAKLARAEGQQFDCVPWVHKARSMPREEFTREVERELTRLDTEPSELIYFKIYKSQAPVIEQALDTAALMLGSDKSRGYCLEMICTDFLAGPRRAALKAVLVQRFPKVSQPPVLPRPHLT